MELDPQASCTFEVCCRDVHPAGGCDQTVRADGFQAVIALACEHGAFAHGFTPAWYSAERLHTIADAVAERSG
ncbi:MAG: hypothetical protein ACXVFN_10225 [Solirubrobacteraceae bacterium]